MQVIWTKIWIAGFGGWGMSAPSCMVAYVVITYWGLDLVGWAVLCFLD